MRAVNLALGEMRMYRQAVDVDTIRFFEELSLNSWPAMQTVYYDGWLIKLSQGYTRRANSVSMLYPSLLSMGEKVEYCEQVYAAHSLKPIFKMTGAGGPPDLDRILDERGYEHDAPSLVMVCDDLGAAPAPEYADAVISEQPTEAWIADYAALSDVAQRYIPHLAWTLRAIFGPKAFVTLYRDNRAVAVGLASVERGCACFHNIVTAAEARGQGIGKQLMRHLIAWARGRGGMRGYLQVLRDNAPAVRLYSGLGFREAYTYWYRYKQI